MFRYRLPLRRVPPTCAFYRVDSARFSPIPGPAAACRRRFPLPFPDMGAWSSSPAVLAALVVGGRFLVNPAMRFIAKTATREIFTAFAPMLIIAICLLMQSVGLSMALGHGARPRPRPDRYLAQVRLQGVVRRRHPYGLADGGRHRQGPRPGDRDRRCRARLGAGRCRAPALPGADDPGPDPQRDPFICIAPARWGRARLRPARLSRRRYTAGWARHTRARRRPRCATDRTRPHSGRC